MPGKSKPHQLSFLVRDQRRQHWHWVSDSIIDLYGSLLGHAALAAYFALCRFANHETQEARPTHKTLAQVTGMSDRHIRRCLETLETMELIQIRAGGAGWASFYTLLNPPTEPERIAANLTRLEKGKKCTTPGHQCPTPPAPVQNVRPTRSVDDDIPIPIDQQQHISRADKEEQEAIYQGLTEFGVSPDVAMELLNNEPPAPVVTLSAAQRWIEYASDTSKGIRNPQGFVVDRLRKGADPPPLRIKRGSQEDRYRYFRGEYADHIQH